MNILILYHEDSACDYHRTILPFRSITMLDGEEFDFTSSSKVLVESKFKNADIVYFNRTCSYGIDHIKRLHKQYNFKLWVDLDDIWTLYPHHYQYNEWKKNNSTEIMKAYMTEADIMTCTNDNLAFRIRSFNDNVKVIPNALPFGFEQFVPNKTESSKIRFIFAGGMSHYYDLKSIDPAFRRLKQMYIGERSEYIMAGYNPHSKGETWEKMKSLMQGLPAFTLRDILPLNDYMKHYDHADVSLAPLEFNEFNTYKSNLKTIEAGCMGMPILVSKMYPYLQDEIAKDQGVFFCEKPDDWFDIIQYLIQNPDKVVEYGHKLNTYVKKYYNLLEINEKRREIINSFK